MIPFVMNAWADRMQIQNVKMIPDGPETLQDLWVC